MTELAAVMGVYSDACDAFGASRLPSVGTYSFIIAKLAEASAVSVGDHSVTAAFKQGLRKSLGKVLLRFVYFLWTCCMLLTAASAWPLLTDVPLFFLCLFNRDSAIKFRIQVSIWLTASSLLTSCIRISLVRRMRYRCDLNATVSTALTKREISLGMLFFNIYFKFRGKHSSGSSSASLG
jgi:hypothetical protein